VRERHQRNGRTDNANRHNWDSEHRDRWHRRDSDLDLSAALISRSVLLQAGILVDRLVAIVFLMRVRKRHSWRLSSLDARLCNADRLGEKHPRREKTADCTTKSGTTKHHKISTSIKKDRHFYCSERQQLRRVIFSC
jgi:hypothetical protein